MDNARWCNYTNESVIRSISQMFQGGHTATQNRTRKNTRRSHTLRVQITHGIMAHMKRSLKTPKGITAMCKQFNTREENRTLRICSCFYTVYHFW